MTATLMADRKVKDVPASQSRGRDSDGLSGAGELRSELIAVADIGFHLENHRDGKLMDEASLASLADSIEAEGLKQPISVQTLAPGKNGGHRYAVVFGHRRLAAVKLLKREFIQAIVKPAMSDADVLVERAIENLQRADLNPMEEIVAVEQAAGACGTAEATAKRLGVSVAFVKDRLLLGKGLGPVTRKLGMAGWLKIGHLRELVKVTDLKEQGELANVMTGGHRYGPAQKLDHEERRMPTVEAVRKEVEASLLDLTKVPWDRSVKFAGCAACDGCPQNTVNDPELFGAPSEAAGRCSNQACFRKKMGESEGAIERVAKRLVALKISAGAGEVAKVKAECKAGFLDPGRARFKVSMEVRKHKSHGPSAATSRKLTPLQAAIKGFEKKLGEWRQGANQAIAAATGKDAMRRAALVLLQVTKAWTDVPGTDDGDVQEYMSNPKPRAPKADEPLSKEATKAIDLAIEVGTSIDPEATLSKIGDLAALPRPKRWGRVDVCEQGISTESVTATVRLATGWGIKLAEPPVWVAPGSTPGTASGSSPQADVKPQAKKAKKGKRKR